MDLSSKYKPIYISELELEYHKIVQYLNSNRTFIVNGSKYCGKSTIVKLYLEYLNYDYLLIDDFNLSKENLIEKIKFRTNSVFSYFNNKKYIVIIDNFDLFDTTIKDFIIDNSNKKQYLIITNKFLHPKINYIRIYSYTIDYILNLYCVIYYLEKGENCNYLPEINNISQMFSILEFTLNSSNVSKNNILASNTSNVSKNNILASNTSNVSKNNILASNTSNVSNVSNVSNKYVQNLKLFFDKFDYKFNDLVIEKNFEKKLYILDKINFYNVFQNNLVYNYKFIDDLANSYDYLSCSTIFLNNYDNIINTHNLEYYSILSMIGTSYNLDNFKIYKENFQIRKKKNLNYYN